MAFYSKEYATYKQNVLNEINSQHLREIDEEIIMLSFLKGESVKDCFNDLMASITSKKLTATGIVSGYEWDCPICGHLNEEIELSKMSLYVCEKCGEDIEIVEWNEAYE